MIKIAQSQLLSFNQDKIKNKKVILRVDFNVEEQNGRFFGLYRIEAVKPTLKILTQAQKVVIISHFGDPDGPQKKYSLKRLLPTLQKILEVKIHFLSDLKEGPQGKFNLLENIRFFKGEKENDLNFAQELAKLGEVFINEAFSVSHRKHASVYLLSKLLPTYFGLQFEKEIRNLSQFLKIKKGLVIILGGAKIKDKLPLIQNFLSRSELVILSGGPANTYLKAKGFEIGQSLSEDELLNSLKDHSLQKIFLPFDFLTSDRQNKFLGELSSKDKILDIGLQSLKVILKKLQKAKYILWNGPLGYIEKKEFSLGTLKLAKFLTKYKSSSCLVGGGDTLGFLEREKLIKKFKLISTGGGAMLHFLSHGTLPIFEE